MPQGYERIDRISEEVRRILDEILREMNDPRMRGTWSLVRCDVTRDLKYCSVRVSVLEELYRAGMEKALAGASGFIRRELGRRANLRTVPALKFEMDTNIEYAAHINSILIDEERRMGEKSPAEQAEDEQPE